MVATPIRQSVQIHVYYCLQACVEPKGHQRPRKIPKLCTGVPIFKYFKVFINTL